jgi:hypothetical protein
MKHRTGYVGTVLNRGLEGRRPQSIEYRVWGALVDPLTSWPVGKNEAVRREKVRGKVGRTWLSEPSGGSRTFIGEWTGRRAVTT